jgi:hypothetical protein
MTTQVPAAKSMPFMRAKMSVVSSMIRVFCSVEKTRFMDLIYTNGIDFSFSLVTAAYGNACTVKLLKSKRPITGQICHV